MTLNSVIKRVRTVCEAHKMIRRFYYGPPTDFLADKTNQYPAVCLQDNPGVLDLAGKQDVYGFRIWLLDLVNVSSDAKENELDVMSDMREIAKDLLSTMDRSEYTDWKISGSNPVECVYEHESDIVGGVYVDFSVTAIWDKNTCAVPTDPIDIEITSEDMKLLYEAYRKCDGTEGSTLDLATDFVNLDGTQIDISGKRISLVVRSNAYHKRITSGTPVIQPVPEVKITSTQAVFSSDAPLNENEPIFILYRTA